MGKLVQFVTSLHTSTKREYLDRMVDEKILCMHKAKEYEEDYWDGDRRICYGGYKYIPSLTEMFEFNSFAFFIFSACHSVKDPQLVKCFSYFEPSHKEGHYFNI